jgi:hypothetical protein
LTVTIHSVSPDNLTLAELERWRSIPVAVAVDVGRAMGQIDPAIRPLLPPGRQPRLFGRAVTALCEPPDFGPFSWPSIEPSKARFWSSRLEATPRQR